MKSSLRIMAFVSVVDVLGFGVLIPLLPYMGERFGASPGVITAILGSYSLCQFIASPFWGRLSDRYGRRPILMSSLAGACLSYVILAFAKGLGLLLLSRILAGFMAGNLAAAFAYASDVSAPDDRAKSMGLIGAAIGVGFMLGMPIGGALAGNQAVTANFVRPALLSVGLSIAAFLLVRFKLPESRRADLETLPRERGPASLRLLRERPLLRAVAGSALLVTCAQGILEYIFAIWAFYRFGVGPRTVGLALFGVALLTVLMQGGFVRALAPRLGEAVLGSLGAGLYALGLLLVGLAGRDVVLVGVGLALAGIGMGAFSPSASALASRQSHGDDRGAVMGTYQACTSLGRVIGPFASGYIYQLIGANAPFLSSACLAVPAACLLWWARHGSRDLERATATETAPFERWKRPGR
ncbi:MAG TPA: MFS transporter [Steroidobacteraceae bacterium]|nr:MFS transporter [Steroidobacteraceae bacterium]